MYNVVNSELPQDLGGGLRLRRSTQADAAAIAHFNSVVQPSSPDNVQHAEGELAWALDLFEGNHPTFGAGDFTVVEDVASGRIVSVTNLIDQVWSYGGIPFGVGRPESVGTLREYRNRGLVRTQFAVLHAWSRARGHLAQAITGIPFYYRQFGYEMAIGLSGGRSGSGVEVPRLGAGDAEPFRIRPAGEDDVDFITQTDSAAGQRWAVACVRDASHWHYEIFGKRSKDLTRLEWRIIESPSGERAGFLGHYPRLFSGSGSLTMPVCELRGGASWLLAAPAVLRYLLAEGERYGQRDNVRLATIGAELGTDHPFLQATHMQLPQVRRPYAWYVRVPDLPHFLQHIAPVLEARLANSPAVGHTGVLKVSLYRQGLRFVLAGGRLAAVEAWRPSNEDAGAAAFPGLSFLQLVFGYRSLDDLHAQYPDCWVKHDEARCLLQALFPPAPSHLWPVS